MPPTAPRSNSDGFTLVELLATMVIIGVLAAIALPTFFGQDAKGKDSAAKTDASSLVVHVESCFAESEDYRACTGASALGTTGLTMGSGAGEVDVTAPEQLSFKVTGHSKSGGAFTIVKSGGQRPTRSCVPPGAGGCHADGSW
jgi:type IV pilus assembly protein PilA